MGYALVAISAVLFAMLWHQWRDSQGVSHDPQQSRYRGNSLRRRSAANLLVGLVGFALLVIEAVPRTPLSLTAYLLCLLLSALWIMGLGIADWRATLQFHDKQQSDYLAEKLRRTHFSQGTKNR